MAERRKFETILLANKLVSEEQLKQTTQYASAVGIDLHEAVLQKKIAPPDAVMMAYAESVGLPFVHFTDISVDEEVTVQIDPVTARQYSLVPVSIDQGFVQVAATKPVVPDVADELRMIFNLPVRCVICTPAELSAAITEYYPRGAVRMTKPEQRTPEPKPKPVPKQKKTAEPMNAEDMKDRTMKTFAAFNFTVALVYFSSFYTPLWRWMGDSSILLLTLGAFVGGVVALIVWRMSSR